MTTNIGLGVVGCFVFTAGALTSAYSHHTLVAVLLAVFANVYVGNTIRLYRKAKAENQPRPRQDGPQV
jgi:uncharacterized membrane protein YccC